MVQSRMSELVPLTVDSDSFFRITGINGQPRTTRIIVDPKNLAAIRDAINSAADQFNALDCATVLSPKQLWRNPIAVWGKFFAKNAPRVSDLLEKTQGVLLVATAATGGVLALGACAYHASFSRDHKPAKQFLDKPLEYVANGFAAAVGVTIAFLSADWLLQRPYHKYQHCKQLNDRLSEMYDVVGAILGGQTPEKEVVPGYLSRVAQPAESLVRDVSRGVPSRSHVDTPSGLGWLGSILGGVLFFAATRGMPLPRATPAGAMGGLSSQPNVFENSGPQNIL